MGIKMKDGQQIVEKDIEIKLIIVELKGQTREYSICMIVYSNYAKNWYIDKK